MVFSDEDKAVIKHFHHRGYTAYKIWKENPKKNWDKTSVKRLINRFLEKGTMERKEGSGRNRTARTPTNEEAVEELICSQEDASETHLSPRNIVEELEITHSSVCRIFREKKLFKLHYSEQSRLLQRKEKRYS